MMLQQQHTSQGGIADLSLDTVHAVEAPPPAGMHETGKHHPRKAGDDYIERLTDKIAISDDDAEVTAIQELVSDRIAQTSHTIDLESNASSEEPPADSPTEVTPAVDAAQAEVPVPQETAEGPEAAELCTSVAIDLCATESAEDVRDVVGSIEKVEEALSCHSSRDEKRDSDKVEDGGEVDWASNEAAEEREVLQKVSEPTELDRVWLEDPPVPPAIEEEARPTVLLQLKSRASDLVASTRDMLSSVTTSSREQQPEGEGKASSSQVQQLREKAIGLVNSTRDALLPSKAAKEGDDEPSTSSSSSSSVQTLKDRASEAMSYTRDVLSAPFTKPDAQPQAEEERAVRFSGDTMPASDPMSTSDIIPASDSPLGDSPKGSTQGPAPEEDRALGQEGVKKAKEDSWDLV